MPRLAPPLPALIAVAALAAGCGAERQPAPDLASVRAPEGGKEVRYLDAGMRFEAPVNWDLRERPGPAVFTLRSGSASVSGFAYVRSEPLPEPGPQLAEAKARLLEEVRRRDEAFEVESATTRELAGVPAIELRGRQAISGRTLETRSVHVFSDGVEYVLEALAPPDRFRLVDREVLSPLFRSLRLGGLRGKRLREGRQRARELAAEGET